MPKMDSCFCTRKSFISDRQTKHNSTIGAVHISPPGTNERATLVFMLLFALPTYTTMAEEVATVDAFGDGFVETVIADASDDWDDPRDMEFHPGRANVSKSELQEVVGGMHKADSKLVVLFGFRPKFGGGKSTGFCIIYDNEDALRKFEPKHRLVRLGIEERTEQSRKAIKEAKNKGKSFRPKLKGKAPVKSKVIKPK